jgi:hypothetical protein
VTYRIDKGMVHILVWHRLTIFIFPLVAEATNRHQLGMIPEWYSLASDNSNDTNSISIRSFKRNSHD